MGLEAAAVQVGPDTGLALRLVHLYPDLMNTYGDRGNVLALLRRCQWRGIQPSLVPVSLGEAFCPEDVDILFMGGGQDREQAAICRDFIELKGAPLREAVESEAPMLAVCGAYQLLGRHFTTHTGEVIPGIGLLDAWTVAGDRRCIGNVVVRSNLEGELHTLVGFENHSGKTYLGAGCEPLGRVEVGYGNNGEDGTEGCVHRNLVATYLHGSLLPKNPWLTDWLILQALRRRYGAHAALPPLNDDLETRAHQSMVQRARKPGWLAAVAR